MSLIHLCLKDLFKFLDLGFISHTLSAFFVDFRLQKLNFFVIAEEILFSLL
jgi:hypothetical protein